MKSFLEFLIENQNQSPYSVENQTHVWVITEGELNIGTGDHKNAFPSIYIGDPEQSVPVRNGKVDTSRIASAHGRIVPNKHGIPVVNIVTPEGGETPMNPRRINRGDIDTRVEVVGTFQNHFGKKGKPFLIDAGTAGFHTPREHIKHLLGLAGYIDN